MVTETKGVVQLRPLIYDLGMEQRLLRSWETHGYLRKTQGICFVWSFVGLCFPISLGAPKDESIIQ